MWLYRAEVFIIEFISDLVSSFQDIKENIKLITDHAVRQKNDFFVDHELPGSRVVKVTDGVPFVRGVISSKGSRKGNRRLNLHESIDLKPVIYKTSQLTSLLSQSNRNFHRTFKSDKNKEISCSLHENATLHDNTFGCAAIPDCDSLDKSSDFLVSKKISSSIDDAFSTNKCEKIRQGCQNIQDNLKEHRKEHEDYFGKALKEPPIFQDFKQKGKGIEILKEFKNDPSGFFLKKKKLSWTFFSPRTESLFIYPVFNSSLHGLMRYEMLRIRSFDKCSAQNVSFAQLAQAGFYYSGANGKVTCFACQNSHEGFLFKVVSAEAHRYGCQRALMNIAVSQGSSSLSAADFELFDSIYDISDLWESGYASEPAASTSTGKTRTVTQAQADEGQVYFVYTSATKEQPLEFNPYSKAWINSDNRSELQGAEGGSSAVQLPFLDLRGAAYPLFANRRTRRDTFHSWDLNHSQKPEDLVNLGFFYAGYSDCARCFYCGLGLKYWRPNDNAAYQHARFRPQCLYNCFVKGQAFIDQVQREIANETQGRDRDQAEMANGHVVDTPEVPNIGQLMRSDAVRQVLEENWTQDQVKQGVIKLIQDLGEECLVYDILSDVMQRIFQQGPPAASDSHDGRNTSADHAGENVMEDHDGQIAVEQSVAKAIPSTQTQSVTENESTTSASTATTNVNLPTDLVLRLLEREHNYLKKRLHCMVCGANKIGCIYLPCGHVVACLTCGDLASTCVLCDKVISATANIYMS